MSDERATTPRGDALLARLNASGPVHLVRAPDA